MRLWIYNIQSCFMSGIFRSYDNALRWKPRDLTDVKPTFVQVMAWCRQATSHYLSQCWTRSMSPYGITRPQWVIGIDHDTVCAGVVGTAIRNSTSCAGRRAAAPAGTTSAVPDCSTNHDSADLISGQFLFYHDHNLQKVRETCAFDVLYRCSSPSAFA